jgi:uncharacterized iron-regulated membrane protein
MPTKSAWLCKSLPMYLLAVSGWALWNNRLEAVVDLAWLPRHRRTELHLAEESGFFSPVTK